MSHYVIEDWQHMRNLLMDPIAHDDQPVTSRVQYNKSNNDNRCQKNIHATIRQLAASCTSWTVCCRSIPNAACSGMQSSWSRPSQSFDGSHFVRWCIFLKALKSPTRIFPINVNCCSCGAEVSACSSEDENPGEDPKRQGEGEAMSKTRRFGNTAQQRTGVPKANFCLEESVASICQMTNATRG
jgi:hypothetical protein